MDYILLSAILGILVLYLAISYNIVCQWKKYLATRAKIVEEALGSTTRLEDLNVIYALPVWHAAAHETSCQTENSLSYVEGVGRTDGEGIERTWSVLNPLAYSTKEMGNGARHDAIENKVDHLNFEKNVGQGDTLARKLIVAITERDKQVAEFREVDSSINKETRLKWEQRINEWRADRENKPNPYCLAGGKGAGPTEAAILLELKTAEALEVAEGREAASNTQSTPTAFIKSGLQLEESQAEIKGVTLVTADRASQIEEMRISFHRKFRTFERLQDTFMPGVAALKEQAEDARDPDTAPPKAEELKLWLPSELRAEERRVICKRGVAEVEAKLRRGQCVDALDTVRSRLHAQTHLILWRNSHSTGQRATTRSATLIGRVGDRIKRVVEKYRRAREALLELVGDALDPQFKELRASDLTTGAEEENDGAARKKLAKLGSLKRTRIERSSKKTVFSWIWTVGGGPGEDDAQLHECNVDVVIGRQTVRVEWSKACARKDRWVEEVQLLREEMKRVLRMLRWIQGQWQERAVDERADVTPELRAGLRTYAERQVYTHRKIAEAFHTGWSCLMASAVKRVVEQDGWVYRELVTGERPSEGGVAELEAAAATDV
ncbi:hypothetical protein B0H14DRAFT_2581072 [Mycena olivaceomarginata]|nr:hypothetical protein B0H14DRAFT_2581072 [Mycena olivaceomarginata]